MEDDIENNKSKLGSIIEDNSGGLSSTRVLMLVWGVGVLLVWGFSTIVGVLHGIYTPVPIPESVVTVLFSVVGFKTVQRFGEK